MLKAQTACWSQDGNPGRGSSQPASHPLLDTLSVRGAGAPVRRPQESCCKEGARAPGAHRGPHMCTAFPSPASALPRGGPAAPRRKHLQTFLHQQTLAKRLETAFWAILLCGEQAHLHKGWGVRRVFYLFCFLVVNVWNKRPFSKPLPFQICPGLNSGDPKPHLPTSCSRLEPNTRTPRFFAPQAESLHRW